MTKRVQIQNLMQKDAPSKFSQTGFQKVWVVTGTDEQGQPITFDSFVGKWNTHWQAGIAIDFDSSQMTSRQYQDQSGATRVSNTLKAPPSARPAQYGGQAPQQGFAPQQQPQYAPPQATQPQLAVPAPGYNDTELRQRVDALEVAMKVVMDELSLRKNSPAESVAPPVGTGQPPAIATQANAVPFPAGSTVQGGELLPPAPLYDEEIRQEDIPQ